MKDFADDGGGPAGVVEGLVPKMPEPLTLLLALRWLDAGVAGGLDERGTVQVDMTKY